MDIWNTKFLSKTIAVASIAFSANAQSQALPPACEQVAKLVDVCYPEMDNTIQIVTPGKPSTHKKLLEAAAAGANEGLPPQYKLPANPASMHMYFTSFINTIKKMKADGLAQDIDTNSKVAEMCAQQRPLLLQEIVGATGQLRMAAGLRGVNSTFPKCRSAIVEIQ